MSQPPIKFVFGLHFHQPVGNFDHVFADHLRDNYRPILERCVEADFLPLTVHYSGPLLEWLEQHEPKFLDDIGRLASDGKLELLCAGFDEPILASLPRPDRQEQIGRLRDFIQRRFGVTAAGLWLTERVWEPELAADLHDAGVRYALIDDRHFLVSGFAREQLHRPFRTESDGRGIALLAIDERLRYLIPFRPPEETAAYLRQLRAEGHTVAVLADDGEKFGGWPGTKQWVYDRGYLASLFETVGKLFEAGEAKLATASEAVQGTRTAGLAYLPTASYREMEGWSLPAPAQVSLQRVEDRLGKEWMAAGEGALVRGGHWRHFLVKYAEANRLHKMMVALSALCRSRGDPPAARRAIGRAQCNDVYWHGVFGGLYLPHLRHALWRQLALAERELRADEPLSYEQLDIDHDGFDELWIHSASFSAIVSPQRGGAIEVLQRFGTEENLADALTRRREAYHEPAPPSTSQQIETELSVRAGELPPVDYEPRGLVQDRVIPGDLTIRPFMRATYLPVRTWASEALAWKADSGTGSLRITLNAPDVEKVLEFHESGRVTASWQWDTAHWPTAFFASELSLARELEIEAPGAELWRFPITTVAKSERGLEETVQGVSMTCRWPGTLGRASLVIP